MLSRAKDVEIPQSNCLHAVQPAEELAVTLADLLLQCIRRERIGGHALHLGKFRTVTVDRRRGRENNPSNARIARRHQHVEGGVDIRRV